MFVDFIIPVIAAGVATFGFALLFNIRGKNLFSKATFSFFTDKNKKTTGALSFGYKKAWEK